jgi:hypothetical protein
MDFTGVIAKINPFLIIFTEIFPYFEVEKYPFRKNLVRACAPPLCHLKGGGERQTTTSTPTGLCK